jgi:RsiW-degrading membrane proteinase PrsW (M82 family)
MNDREKSFVVLLLFALLFVLGIWYWIYDLPNPRPKAWFVLIGSSIFLGLIVFVMLAGLFAILHDAIARRRRKHSSERKERT